MVFIGVLIFSYTDLINEIEKKSKIQEEAGEPPRLPVNGEFEKYDFEPVERWISSINRFIPYLFRALTVSCVISSVRLIIDFTIKILIILYKN